MLYNIVDWRSKEHKPICHFVKWLIRRFDLQNAMFPIINGELTELSLLQILKHTFDLLKVGLSQCFKYWCFGSYYMATTMLTKFEGWECG